MCPYERRPREVCSQVTIKISVHAIEQISEKKITGKAKRLNPETRSGHACGWLEMNEAAVNKNVKI